MISKKLKIYKTLPEQVKASFWFLICAFLQKGISFITTPIFTRLLTTTEYGRYNVFSSWMGIIIVVVSLNLYSGVYSRGLVKFENDRKIFSSSLQGLTLFLVLIWTVVYLFLHNFWNKLFSLTTVQMLLMIQMIWTTSVFCFWSMEQRADFKYQKLVIVTLIVSVAKPIIGIICVTNAQDKVTARIFGLAVVELVVYTAFFFSQVYHGKKMFSSIYWKHALQFNIPLIPHYLSTSIMNSADRIMISRMVGQSQSGIYSLAYSVSLIMTMFNTALMQTIEPWLYRKIKDKKISDISKVAYPAFMIIAIVNIALIALAPEIISIFAPSEYYNAIWVVPPIAMSVFFMFSYTFFAIFEFYYAKTKLIAIATCIGGGLNIILNYIFIKVFGYYAAGYTTLICFIIYTIFHFIFMRKICKECLDNQQPYDLKIYLCIATVFMALGFLFLFSYYHNILRYSLIIAILLFMLLQRKRLIGIIIDIVSIKGIKEDDF